GKGQTPLSLAETFDQNKANSLYYSRYKPLIDDAKPPMSMNGGKPSKVFDVPAVGQRFTVGTDTDKIPPSKAADPKAGYYWLTSDGAVPDDGTIVSKAVCADLKYRIDKNDTTKPTIVLQRLADPRLPIQVDPSKPNFNPFITVDFMTDVPVNDK